MSKQDNLHDFLTDIADAVREKKGTTEPINAQMLSEEIKNLPSGGQLSGTFIDSTGLGNQNVEHVVIADGVKVIKSNSYYNFLKLETILVPAGLLTIGGYAFYNCSSLQAFEFPDSVFLIDSYSFFNCRSIEMLSFPADLNKINDGAFQNCVGVICFDFRRCVAIPTLANTNAFNNTTGVFIVPDALYDEWIVATNWSTYADRIVKASEYVYLDFADPVVEKICAENFGDGTGTTQAQANKVTTFLSIFQNNTDITSFDEFERFENVTDLGYAAFINCTSLSSITFPNLKNLPGNVFLGCSSLDIDVNLPSLMTISGDRQFNNSAIRKVTSLGSITSLSAAMFEQCTNLIEVTIPITCATISVSAFYGCTALESIVCNPTTPPVLNSVIPNQSTVYVPDESVDAYKSATNWSKYAGRIKPLSEY